MSTTGSKWWEHVELGNKFPTKGGSRRWKCKYCHQEKGGGTDRVRAHLTGEKGHGISACTMLSEERKAFFVALAKSMDAPPRQRPLDPQARTSTVVSSSSGAQGTSLSEVGSSSQTLPPKPTHQSTILSTWHPQQRSKVDASVARFFYGNGISFNVARSPYWKEMMQDVARFGPTYVPPSYEALRTKLLDDEVTSIKHALESIKEGWAKNGITLIGDGWSDTRARSIQGIVAYSRGKSFFVSSIDNSIGRKTADRLAELWSEAIEYVGSSNVVQFIGDGEPANRAAGALIEGRYPHIFFSPCIAHCLNNILKDIGKMHYFSSIIETGRDVVTFITRHHYILAIFRKLATRDLLKYSDTRFAYNFIMLQRLQEEKNAVRQLVVSEDWTTWPLSKAATGKKCYQAVLDDVFWTNVEHVLAIVAPIIRMLRLVDGDEPCIGKVYEGLDRMIENIREIVQDAQPEIYQELHDLCQTRWDSYYSKIQAAAFVLDPEFQGKSQERDTEVQRGWHNTLDRLVEDQVERRKIKDQLAFYRSRQGLFGYADALADRFIVSSALWWEDYGSDTPELQRLAIRILSQGASSSPCERLWSSFGHIAPKKRNRLGALRMNDLVFVNANLRLLNSVTGEYQKERYIGYDLSDSDDEMSEHVEGEPSTDPLDEELASLFQD